ncbi:hypothetical protein CON73_08610 [Bacillus toyonensis]|uniref:IstB-like ATP-binding domain-containing protein n=1 Tax=Bacillus toyonensis TaxID=155322 RepID=A0A2B7W172_9BACI|nr:hypothetical protein CON73_08610 [Bacillus toyonensis]
MANQSFIRLTCIRIDSHRNLVSSFYIPLYLHQNRRKSQTIVKRVINADLVIIDDIMYMAMDQKEATLFFHIINQLYDHTSIIFTSNKGPEEWGELIGDPGITTAILDRIIHRVEVIHLNGDSFRMKYRSTIFQKEFDQS